MVTRKASYVQIATETTNGVTLVRADGRLDRHSAARLRAGLATLVHDGNIRLILDLEGITHMDTTGLGAIITGLKAVRARCGDLRIARPSKEVRLMLELTALDRVLPPYGSVDEARSGL